MILLRFETQSGSTYEIHEAEKRFRQVEGKGPERRKQWRRYATVVGPEVGYRCGIVLYEDQHTLWTTPVLRMWEVVL